MKNNIKTIALVICMPLLLFYSISCGPKSPAETKVTEITLTPDITDIDCEFSGMTWYKDYLIILPQYPHRFPSPHYGRLWAIPKQQILNYLDASIPHQENTNPPPPLEPIPVDLIDPQNILAGIEEFEGFEAIGFWEDQVFMTIEASPDPMLGHLVSGQIIETTDHRFSITLQGKAAKIPPQADIPNSTYETLLLTKDQIIVIYEGNGKNVNDAPQALIYNHNLEFRRAIPFPAVEYRITDATVLDEQNRFWGINYIWPEGRDRYNPAPDPIANTYGKGYTHAQCQIVERLLQFQYKDTEILLTKTPPLQFQLEDCNKNGRLEDKDSRNWEGLVRLNHQRFNGFLVVTDKFPRTILGFVAL